MTKATDPAAAMAADKALLSQASEGEPRIRIYRWENVCVTLGRSQSAEAALMHPNETLWAARPTGGGAVLHGHDVTLSAAIPVRGDRVSLRLIYSSMAQLAIDYLGLHGVSAMLSSSEGDRLTAEYCFARTAPCDVVEASSRQKICGCALRVTKQAALLQTSIPFEAPRIDPSEIIRGAKWIGAPTWRPDESFDPQSLPSWRRLLMPESA